MKRIFILILTSLLLLTACMKQEPADQGTARTEDAPAAQEPTEQGTVPQTENTAAEAGPTEEERGRLRRGAGGAEKCHRGRSLRREHRLQDGILPGRGERRRYHRHGGKHG